MPRVLLACAALCLSLPPTLPAQGGALDHGRADGLAARWRDKLIEFPDSIHWLDAGAALWFTTGQGAAASCVRVDCATGARQTAATPRELGVAVDDARLAPQRGDARSASGGEQTRILLRNTFDRPLAVRWIDPDGEPHDYGTLAAAGQREQHTYAGHVWRLEFADGEIAGVFRAAPAGGAAVADPQSRVTVHARRKAAGPDGSRVFVRDHDVWLRGAPGEPPARLSLDGKAGDDYRRDLHVSPTGTHVLAFLEEAVETRELTLVESSPRDGLQPRARSVPYRKPGDPLPRPRPRLFDLVQRRPIAVDEAPFADAWSLDRVHWAPDGSEVFVLYNRRGHQQLTVYGIDAATGAVRAVVDERSATFVDYSQKTFLHWLDATGELLWQSERSGHNHLYLVDVATGTARAVTAGDFVVRQVEHVDAERRQVWFKGLGVHAGQDPYFAHLCRASFDGGAPAVLTEADGTHTWEFAPDREHFVARWSRVDHPEVTELRRSSDGALVTELGRDDWQPLLDAGFRPAEPFVSKGRDDRTDIWGLILRPATFDPAARYPVIEAIYAGPHGNHVPKSFGLSLRLRRLAELGFLVVQIDGMGTNWRSKAFHDVCWRDLKDAGFPDRIAWLRAAAAVHPELDLTRVGIFGGSAGGQNALAALLWHGDFYKVAAADCGCHDNRMDKIWWNEAWMGWPTGDWYAASSNVENAHRLQGKLLLTVGELDTNVDPASTLQVVDALVRADKDFEFLLIPGAGHGAGERPYAARRRADFFVRHLLGVQR